MEEQANDLITTVPTPTAANPQAKELVDVELVDGRLIPGDGEGVRQ